MDLPWFKSNDPAVVSRWKDYAVSVQLKERLCLIKVEPILCTSIDPSLVLKD